MTSENQALLDAIRVIAGEAVAPLAERMDGMTERMDGLTEQVGGLTEQVGGLTERMDGMAERMDRVETRTAHLEERVGTIDVRTSQMLTGLLDLRERVPMLEERVDQGFRALKSDLNFAFSDARKVNAMQRNYDKAIDGLKEELADVQVRLTVLESKQANS